LKYKITVKPKCLNKDGAFAVYPEAGMLRGAFMFADFKLQPYIT